MLNNWEILGQFMDPASACRSLVALVRAGLLDLAAVRPKVFPLAALPKAMDAAETAGNLEIVVARP
jgi:alcohol dehydrogenase